MTGQEEEDLKKLHCWPPPPPLLHPPRLQVASLRKRSFHEMIPTSKKYLSPPWVWSLGGVKTSLIPRPGPPRRVSLLTLTKMSHLGVGESFGSSVFESHQSCCNCSRMTGSTPSSTKLCFTPSCKDNWQLSRIKSLTKTYKWQTICNLVQVSLVSIYAKSTL